MEDNMPPRKNPIDAYFSVTKEKRAARDQEDIQLWETWKGNPTPETLQPLLKRFEPTFNNAVRLWKAPNVNESAFRANLAQHAIDAFKVYDPNRGASLNTHITGRIQKAKRFNTRYQNMAYIPEGKADKIGKIDAAKEHLFDELGREPTHQEIAVQVGLSARTVKEIEGLRRADITGSAFQSDPVGHGGSRDQEVISLLRPSLQPAEQPVFDYIYGLNGKPKVESTGDIAKRLGMSPSQVSRIKNRIAATYKKYV